MANKEKIMSNDCEHLHELCNEMKRFRYQELTNVPRNGVYVFFEEGEKSAGKGCVYKS
jgi:hypothetical protein